MNLNSYHKSILVFSDPHQEIDRVDYILKNENYDIAVCLGDWFDSFTHNSEYDVEKTCQFLKKWMFKDNFFTCWGNHDITYLYDNNTTICSGYEHSKDVFISDCLGKFLTPIRDKFNWYLWIDEFLCSHAGISTYHFDPMMELSKDGVTKWLDEQIKIAEPALISGGRHWFYSAGRGRGGSQKIGGIVWQDADIEARPIKGINQIYGHTSHNRILQHEDEIEFLDVNDCHNIDIDCHLAEYLIIKNKKLEIKKYMDL